LKVFADICEINHFCILEQTAGGSKTGLIA
jgi:hypothetical protein